MFPHLQKLDTIPYRINFSEKYVLQECLPRKLYLKMFLKNLSDIHLVKEYVSTVGEKPFAPSPSVLKSNIFANQGYTTTSIKECLKLLRTTNCF